MACSPCCISCLQLASRGAPSLWAHSISCSGLQVLPDLTESRWQYNGRVELGNLNAHEWQWKVIEEEGYGQYPLSYKMYVDDVSLPGTGPRVLKPQTLSRSLQVMWRYCGAAHACLTVASFCRYCSLEGRGVTLPAWVWLGCWAASTTW